MLKTIKITNAPPQKSPLSEEFVHEAIEKHRVCYERWNEFEMVNGVRTHTGYSLRLCGVNDHAGDERTGHPVPGCRFCRKTYDDLRRVAEWILPKEARKSRYKIEPFDYAFHIAPKARHCREEIVVTIQITHRFDPLLPADECESLCLKEMRGKLKELGVLEGRVKSEYKEDG
jgi:hypothetical protein